MTTRAWVGSWLAAGACLASAVAETSAEEPWDGDSASIQRLLDAAREQGGRVELPAGRYRIDAPLAVPEGVTLIGAWDGPHHAQLNRGTVFHVLAGRGDENGRPALTLNPSSGVRGVTFFYPEQRIPGTLSYPWTIQGHGMHGTVTDCTFVNSYKAIDFGTHANELHVIRNCFGCPLKVGVFIDRCTDIGRIENVHFNPHYWARAGAPGTPRWNDLRQYLWENLVAFDFVRTDWEYVLNTFCFGAKVGYRFREDRNGTVNGNFLGIGADWCHRAVLVEASQPPGLLITNGEFVGGEGTDVMMEVTARHNGVVQLSNCAFWGPCETAVRIDGRGSVSLSQCNFQNHIGKPTGAFTVEALGGDVLLQACRFGTDLPDVRLGERVETAVLLGNRFRRSKEIRNESAGDVQEAFSVVTQPPSSRPARG
ncbi:MAG: hypothetical protein AMXMBFR83_14240 [Phycisphaerae bacterium]|jgi:hypothetical protein